MEKVNHQQVIDKIKQKITQLDPKPSDVGVLAGILKDATDLNEAFLGSLPDLISMSQLPRQTFSHRTFSQFPLTLFNHHGYNLDLYFWNRANTSIHDHNFSGAFKVLKGTYHQLTYQFVEEKKYFDWLSKGQLSHQGVNVLLPQDVQTIVHGDEFIHLTHHENLDCVTACLRTEATTGAIHSYFSPSLRIQYVSAGPQIGKLFDYISFLILDFDRNESTIFESMLLVPEVALTQIVLKYNTPDWMKHPKLTEMASKCLEHKYPGSEWVEEVKTASARSQLDRLKLQVLGQR